MIWNIDYYSENINSKIGLLTILLNLIYFNILFFYSSYIPFLRWTCIFFLNFLNGTCMWMVDMWNPGVNAKGFYLFLYSLALRTFWFSPLDTAIISTLISKINRVAQGCSSPFLETSRTLSVNAVCSWLEINLER